MDVHLPSLLLPGEIFDCNHMWMCRRIDMEQDEIDMNRILLNNTASSRASRQNTNVNADAWFGQYHNHDEVM
jgi:hypothetical protein